MENNNEMIQEITEEVTNVVCEEVSTSTPNGLGKAVAIGLGIVTVVAGGLGYLWYRNKKKTQNTVVNEDEIVVEAEITKEENK